MSSELIDTLSSSVKASKKKKRNKISEYDVDEDEILQQEDVPPPMEPVNQMVSALSESHC